MTKIFKSKRISIFALLFVLLFSTGCFKNKHITEKDGANIVVSTHLTSYFKVQTTLPTLHFDMKNVNVMYDTNNSSCFFVNNDQYKLSDAFAKHLKMYDQDDIIVISESLQSYDKEKARFGKEYKVLDKVDEFGNEQTASKEYQIVACNDDGTRYSYQFRTFVSEGKRYYIFRYTSNIGISLEQSLMVIKEDDGTNSLLLIPLPYDTKYEVSGATLSLKSLIEKDTYLAERYRKFAYPDYLKDMESNEEKNEMIRNWYTKYCNGHYDENGRFVFEYYGARFSVEFGITDCGNTANLPGFQLTYLKD